MCRDRPTGRGAAELHYISPAAVATTSRARRAWVHLSLSRRRSRRFFSSSFRRVVASSRSRPASDARAGDDGAATRMGEFERAVEPRARVRRAPARVQAWTLVGRRG